jgi:ankyrin repeat protein
MPALWDACCSGNVAEVVAAVERGEGVDTRGHHNDTVLIVAATLGHIEVASFLLWRGAAVNAVDTDQQTAMHVACYKDNAGMVRLLLAQPGVDCNPREELGMTPLMVAVMMGKVECVRELVGDPRVELDTRTINGGTLDTPAR